MSLVEFDRGEIERLLGLLDGRLHNRGAPGSVYVIGGAAIAVTIYGARRTIDIDALVSDPVVLEEARLLAEAEGIPPSWLNENASRGYLPGHLWQTFLRHERDSPSIGRRPSTCSR